MAVTQNGWAVQNDSNGMWKHSKVGPILAGPVWVVFANFLHTYDVHVETIGPKSGCYNLRKIAGSTKYSNHASATAVDLNWDDHPATGKYVGFSPPQINAIGFILKRFPVLRWGSLYNDPMHFEIAPGTKLEDVEELATKLLQTQLAYRGYLTGPIDGKRGPKTKAALTDYQKRARLVADGVDGPKVWESFGIK